MLLAVPLAFSCARDSSRLPIEYSVGKANPVLGAKVSLMVTSEFQREDVDTLYAALQSEELREQLRAVSCGEEVPTFRYTVSLWQQAPMHIRHIEVREEPWLENRPENACLVGGLQYFVYERIRRIERARRGGRPDAARVPGLLEIDHDEWSGVSCDCQARSRGEIGVQNLHRIQDFSDR